VLLSACTRCGRWFPRVTLALTRVASPRLARPPPCRAVPPGESRTRSASDREHVLAPLKTSLRKKTSSLRDKAEPLWRTHGTRLVFAGAAAAVAVSGVTVAGTAAAASPARLHPAAAASVLPAPSAPGPADGGGGLLTAGHVADLPVRIGTVAGHGEAAQLMMAGPGAHAAAMTDQAHGTRHVPGHAARRHRCGTSALQRWICSAEDILARHGIPRSALDTGAAMIVVLHESGGNPHASNGWDSNAAAGTPSQGIAQTIGPTFDAYSLPGHRDIWNPVDNMVAAFRYAIGKYGSMSNIPGVVAVRHGGAYVGY
jgi:hypothetical protein